MDRPPSSASSWSRTYLPHHLRKWTQQRSHSSSRTTRTPTQTPGGNRPSTTDLRDSVHLRPSPHIPLPIHSLRDEVKLVAYLRYEVKLACVISERRTVIPQNPQSAPRTLAVVHQPPATSHQPPSHPSSSSVRSYLEKGPPMSPAPQPSPDFIPEKGPPVTPNPV